MFPIAAAPWRYLASSRIQGVTHTLHEGFDFTGAWIQA